MRCIITLVALATISIAAAAQDTVKLQDGSRIDGDIVYEDKSQVDIVDLVGTKHSFPRAEVKSAKKGKGFGKAIASRLEEVNEADPDALFAIAREALADRKTAKDGQRLLRRVLALDDQYPKVRELLGQVHALDRWFEDEKSAGKAIDAHYKELGWSKTKGAWIGPEAEADFKAEPEDFMVDEGAWRPRLEVMKERGNLELRGNWYAPEEKDFVHYSEVVAARCELVLDGAQTGCSVVLHYKGREHAKRLSAKLMAARDWFAETFRRPAAARKPLGLEVVLEKKAAFETFKARIGDAIAMPPAMSPRPDMGEAFGLGFTDLLGAVAHDEIAVPGLPAGLIESPRATGELDEAHMMIHLIGMRLMVDMPDEPGRMIPDAMVAAAATYAEIVAMGKTRVSSATEESKYDRSGMNDFHGNVDADVADLRKRLKETLKTRKISLRSWFFATGIQLDEATDQYGVTLLDWMLQTRREALIAFLHDPDFETGVDRLFEKHFGMSFEAAEKEFLAWL
ncbi:MAG: hypothetical protein H6807_06310 [Planctomycetes bacterium]|nr:hypothetical protein [Planctomycetota bacterium]